MKRWATFLLAGWLGCGAVQASELDKLTQFIRILPGTALPVATPMSLGQLLATIRQKYPYAMITGRFSDPRSVSIYRRVPGLHNGYDIGLDAGAVVPAAWSGEVVAITPWYGQEHGISVVTGQREATYGHLIPLVRVGQHVEVGQPLGVVARDHVDVKMRGSHGEFIDFGVGEQEFAVAALTPEQRYQRYLQARYQFLVQTQQLEQARKQLKKVTYGKDESPALLAQDKEWKDLYQMGAVSRVEFEAKQKQIQQGLNLVRNKPIQVKKLKSEVHSLEGTLKSARAALLDVAHGLDLQAAQRYLNAFLSNRSVTTAARPATPSVSKLRLPPIRPDLQELYEEGVISKSELEKLSNPSH